MKKLDILRMIQKIINQKIRLKSNGNSALGSVKLDQNAWMDRVALSYLSNFCSGFTSTSWSSTIPPTTELQRSSRSSKFAQDLIPRYFKLLKYLLAQSAKASSINSLGTKTSNSTIFVVLTQWPSPKVSLWKKSKCVAFAAFKSASLSKSPNAGQAVLQNLYKTSWWWFKATRHWNCT